VAEESHASFPSDSGGVDAFIPENWADLGGTGEVTALDNQLWSARLCATPSCWGRFIRLDSGVGRFDLKVTRMRHDRDARVTIAHLATRLARTRAAKPANTQVAT